MRTAGAGRPASDAASKPFLRLDVERNPYPASPRVLEAVRGAATRTLRFASDPEQLGLRRVLGERLGVEPDEILVGSSPGALLSLLVRHLLEPHDALALPVPGEIAGGSFSPPAGARMIEVPYPEDFSLPGSLAAAAARVTLLSNPNGSSGTLVPEAAIERLAGELTGLLIVDETAVEFASGGALGARRRHGNALLLRSIGQAHSLAGLGPAFAVGAASLVSPMRLLVARTCAPERFAAAAAEAALADPDWARATAARVCATRERAIRALRAFRYDVWPSESSFVLARVGPHAASLVQSLRERGVLVRFDATPRLRKCIRISIGTDEEMETFFAALTEVVTGRRPTR